jgi:hypothetical protein
MVLNLFTTLIAIGLGKTENELTSLVEQTVSGVYIGQNWSKKHLTVA